MKMLQLCETHPSVDDLKCAAVDDPPSVRFEKMVPTVTPWQFISASWCGELMKDLGGHIVSDDASSLISRGGYELR
jgi:hypothetical protein